MIKQIKITATINVPDNATDSDIKKWIEFETGIVGSLEKSTMSDEDFQTAMNESKYAQVSVS